MDSFEIKKINAYFNKQFNTNDFSLKVDENNSDSAEVYFKNEFLGLIYKDDEDGEIAFQFHMTILDEDLLDA
tara:strand:+ start:188 stop:403 length:216 start_codon:yes stop_codon:yes gene_type:complete